ncbi:F-box domain containing protein [Parasponia andersonii]|uniref:F-box domain containing protein n=1 Tax=Parasponia andersonii TaxID=3476 RepID=A0A2P5C5Q5_PARAD|nr:F-box domain containing protein [Parasponia andersonii]
MALSEIDKELELPLESAASKFWSVVGDDLLREIFYRLPRYRFVIRCSIVCKRWYSVINSNFDELVFENHNRKHNTSSSDDHSSSGYFSSCTLLLSLNKIDRPLYLLFLDKSNTSSISTTTFLNFVPWPEHDLVIQSSLDDMLLVSRKCNPTSFCVCNPLTEKWIALPEAPNDRPRRGLVRDDQNRFRVVLLDIKFDGYHDVYYATIFSSETGKWSESSYKLPPLMVPEIFGLIHGPYNQSQGVSTTNGGRVHWLRAGDVIEFSSYVERGPRLFVLPEEFGNEQDVRLTSCLGVVRGQLRLLEIFKRGFGFVLKVWELNHESGEWNLVHHRVKWVASMFKMLALHPADGDEIFMLRDYVIWIYNIREDRYKRLGESPKIPDEEIGLTYLDGIFTLTHPVCPTSLFALPPSH